MNLAQILADESARTNTIIRYRWSEELEAEMLAISDDSTDGWGEVEFWGADFRVHLVRED